MISSPITRIDIAAFARRALCALEDEVVLADGRLALTGGEVLARTASLSRALQEAGLAPGERVMLAMAPRVEAVEAAMAIIQAGLVAVPVSTDWSPAEITAIRAAVGARFAIADAAGFAALGHDGVERGFLCAAGGPMSAGWSEYPVAGSGAFRVHDAADHDRCMMMPGVNAARDPRIGVADHRSVALTGAAATFMTGTVAARVVIAQPMHGPVLIAAMWLALVCGAPVFVMPEREVDDLVDAIGRWRATAVLARQGDSHRALPQVIAAGQPRSRGPLLWNTVVAPDRSYCRPPGRHLAGLPAAGVRIGSVIVEPVAGFIARRGYGESSWRPFPMVEFAVRGADGITRERGVEGPLALRSPQLCRRLLYDNRTAQAFADGWYDTGLVGRLTGAGFRPLARRRHAITDGRATGDGGADTASLVVQATAADIGALIRRGAAFRDKTVALIDGRRRVAYGRLVDRARRLSAALAQRFGIVKGDRVGFLALNRAEFMEAYLATVQLGAVFVPVNFRLTAKEAVYILNDAGVRVLIAEPEFAPVFATLRAEVPSLEAIIGLAAPGLRTSEYDRLVAGHEPLADFPAIADDDPCALLYTAGTTGFPKGAVRSHKAVLWFGLASSPNTIRARADGVHLAAPPMFHIAGHETAVVPALMAGARVVVLRRFDPEAVLDLVARHRVTSVFVPPTMAFGVLDAMRRRDDDLSSLVDWSSASAPLPPVVRDEVLRRLPSVCFRNSLGMTEVGGVSVLEGARLASKPETCVGRPLPTMEVGIVDLGDRLLGRGETGEIVLRSPQIVEGYWRNEAATREAMRGGWFHTGDLGSLDAEGYLHILGRLKDMILTGGENVYAAEVENVLLAMPEIAEAAVVGLPDPRWGEVVTAFLVLKDGARIDAEGIVARCRDEIAGYKCPRKVVFAETLPRSPIGKVQKHLLREAAPASGTAA